MTSLPFDTIVFDLDGTLIDSALDVGLAVNRVLQEEGLPQMDEAIARSLMGEGGKVMVARAFAKAGRKLEEAALNALTRRFIGYYKDNPVAHTLPYPGVPETLQQLQRDGARMAVCTNKFEGPARQILVALDLMRFLDDVAGADTFAVRKPDPGHVTQLAARMGASLRHAVMVGDSMHDVHAGHGAKIPVVAVSWGYTVQAPATFGAEILLERFADLPQALVELARQRQAV
ncbi:MAG: gph [Alphaproteobacteria bacterium]|jgi:phosphoglycolate phosphatase|nr:gph [Alphaproteobacteria bacterium]